MRSSLKVLKVAHKKLLWSGGEIRHIGRYGGHKWHVWFLGVGCTSNSFEVEVDFRYLLVLSTFFYTYDFEGFKGST